MRLIATLAALLVTTPALADRDLKKDDGADSGAVAGLEWTWEDGQHRRYYVESEVHLPLFMWFNANYNKNARVAAFQIRAVLDCTSVDALRNGHQIACDVADVGLQAGALPGDRGRLQPVLEELDDKLTGSTIQFVQKADGKLTGIGLRDVTRRTRRMSRMQENLRLVMARALAGLDVRLPRKGYTRDRLWTQHEGQLYRIPSVTGTSGSAEVVHRIDAESDGIVALSSGGRAMIIPAEEVYTQGSQGPQGFSDGPRNLFETTISGEAKFDTGSGALTAARWSALGMPTASSALADGWEGVPYGQWGKLKLLADGETVPVGDTKEVAPPNVTPSTLQQWTSLGSPRPQ